MTLGVELDLDPVMDEALLLQPLADPDVDEEVHRPLFEDACADSVLDVVPRPVLENDRLDAFAVEQLGEREPRRAGAHDPDLRAHQGEPWLRLLEHLLRDLERPVRGRDAAVDRAVQEDLLDLVRRDADPARGAHVHRELLLAAERDEHAEREQAAGLPVEPGPRPDLSPGVARDGPGSRR